MILSLTPSAWEGHTGQSHRGCAGGKIQGAAEGSSACRTPARPGLTIRRFVFWCVICSDRHFGNYF